MPRISKDCYDVLDITGTHESSNSLVTIKPRKKSHLQKSVVFVFTQDSGHLIQMYINNCRMQNGKISATLISSQGIEVQRFTFDAE